MSPWLLVTLAGVLEVVWALAMKRSDGFTRAPETLVFVVASVASFVLLSRALRDLPVGSGYAVWTGIGAVGAAVVGAVWLHEPMTIARALSLGAVVVGIAGLAATTSH
jgi:quaternary ammonium compound-resistance protein SugE